MLSLDLAAPQVLGLASVNAEQFQVGAGSVAGTDLTPASQRGRLLLTRLLFDNPNTNPGADTFDLSGVSRRDPITYRVFNVEAAVVEVGSIQHPLRIAYDATANSNQVTVVAEYMSFSGGDWYSLQCLIHRGDL